MSWDRKRGNCFSNFVAECLFLSYLVEAWLASKPKVRAAAAGR
jgi:hypothetical protein